MRNRRDGDGRGPGGVKGSEVAKEMRCGLAQVARRREVHAARPLAETIRAKTQPGFTLMGLGGVEANRRERRIMGCQPSGRQRPIFGIAALVHDRMAENIFRHGPCDAAGAQQGHFTVEAGQDGRFEAHLGCAPINHRVDPALEVGEHMVRERGADMAGPVRRRRGDRAPQRPDQGMRHRMRRTAEGHARKTRRHQFGHGAIWRARNNQRQRPRPERRRQFQGRNIEDAFALRIRQ
jgi:hypothetical protein